MSRDKFRGWDECLRGWKPKVKHLTEEGAMTAVLSMEARFGGIYEAYICGRCGCWHVGHHQQSPHRRTPEENRNGIEHLISQERKDRIRRLVDQAAQQPRVLP